MTLKKVKEPELIWTSVSGPFQLHVLTLSLSPRSLSFLSWLSRSDFEI